MPESMLKKSWKLMKNRCGNGTEFYWIFANVEVYFNEKKRVFGKGYTRANHYIHAVE